MGRSRRWGTASRRPDQSWKEDIINRVSNAFSRNANEVINDKLRHPFMDLLCEKFGTEITHFNNLCPTIKAAHSDGEIGCIGVTPEQANGLGLHGQNCFSIHIPALPIMPYLVCDDSWQYRYEDYSKFPINLNMIKERVGTDLWSEIQECITYGMKADVVRTKLTGYLNGKNSYTTKWGESMGNFDTFQQACYSFPHLKYFSPNVNVVNLRRPKIVYAPPKDLQDLVAEAVPLFKAQSMKRD